MLATALAQKEGYHQVLWTDACEHVWLQEVGTMNVFFVLKNKIITPSLEEGTILEGVTRATAITLLKDKGYEVEERKIHINELIDEYKKGNFTEAFGTGTAAIVSPIKELKYRDFLMQFQENKIAHAIKKSLADIHEGNAPDTYNWLVAV
jgi:branched-chain amino acid aminotransferase